MQSLVAWIVLPFLLLALSHGLGALLATIARVEPPAALLAPVGAGLGVSLSLAGYVAGLRGVTTSLVIAVLAVAGWVLAARGGRLRFPQVGAVVWAATYALYIAPVVLTGHWTWLGYNFVNDTSVQLLLAEWLPEHGRTAPPQFAATQTDVILSYINTGYPLGSHALLAAVHELIPIPSEALYQPFIAAFGGLGAMALWVLARRVASPWWAAFAAVVAMASNLLYQYSLQGNMKEIVTAALLATAAAVGSWSLGALRDAPPEARPRILRGAALLMAAPAAGVVNALSTAGGPYVLVLIALWVVLLLAHRLVPSIRAFASALVAGTVALALLTAATLSTLVKFGEATSGAYAAPNLASELGHLARPLEVRQTVGIWLTGDYRLPPVGSEATVTDLAIPFAVLLALVALGSFARRRRLDVLLFALPVVAIMLVVTPRVSPYADAKTYMLMAPAVTLLAALGAAALARWKAASWVAAGVLALTVMGSDALAYHSVRYAPTDRMAALHDLDWKLDGQGQILFNEPEEFAKNFMGDTGLVVSSEAITPRHTALRVPQAFAYLWFDLDDQQLNFVEKYPLIVVRRSPAASRPPADYELSYSNAFYDVWRRNPRPRILEHLSLQGLDQVAGEPNCADVKALAARVRPGERLVAATAAPTVRLDPLNADSTPRGWRPHPFRAGRVLTGTPGTARTRVEVEQGGRYRAWIAGTFGRAIEGLMDGRTIGAARGVNTVGQFHEIGTIDVPAGSHELALRRGHGDAAPGDGYSGELGPLVLERVGPRPLVSVRPEDAERRLCGRQWDWIERLEP